MKRQFPQAEVKIGNKYMGHLGAEVMIFRFPACCNFWDLRRRLRRGEEGRHATHLLERTRKMARMPMGKLGKLPRDQGHMFSSPPKPTKGILTN